MRLATAWAAVLLCVTLLNVTTANADQNDPALPALFDQLQSASDVASASALESQIWQLWLDAPSAEADRLLRAVVDAMEQRDFREALILSTELVDSFPQYAEGWNKRATVYYLMGNFDASVGDITRTLELEPRHFGAISGLGLIFRIKGDVSAAVQAFEQVLLISPMAQHARRAVDELKQQSGSEI